MTITYKSWILAAVAGLAFVSVGLLLTYQFQESRWQRSVHTIWAELDQWETRQQMIRKKLMNEQSEWTGRVEAQEEELAYLRFELKQLKNQLTSLSEHVTDRQKTVIKKADEKYVSDDSVSPGYLPRPESVREKPGPDPAFYD